MALRTVSFALASLLSRSLFRNRYADQARYLSHTPVDLVSRRDYELRREAHEQELKCDSEIQAAHEVGLTLGPLEVDQGVAWGKLLETRTSLAQARLDLRVAHASETVTAAAVTGDTDSSGAAMKCYNLPPPSCVALPVITVTSSVATTASTRATETPPVTTAMSGKAVARSITANKTTATVNHLDAVESLLSSLFALENGKSISDVSQVRPSIYALRNAPRASQEIIHTEENFQTLITPIISDLWNARQQLVSPRLSEALMEAQNAPPILFIPRPPAPVVTPGQLRLSLYPRHTRREIKTMTPKQKFKLASFLTSKIREWIHQSHEEDSDAEGWDGTTRVTVGGELRSLEFLIPGDGHALKRYWRLTVEILISLSSTCRGADDELTRGLQLLKARGITIQYKHSVTSLGQPHRRLDYLKHVPSATARHALTPPGSPDPQGPTSLWLTTHQETLALDLTILLQVPTAWRHPQGPPPDQDFLQASLCDFFIQTATVVPVSGPPQRIVFLSDSNVLDVAHAVQESMRIPRPLTPSPELHSRVLRVRFPGLFLSLEDNARGKTPLVDLFVEPTPGADFQVFSSLSQLDLWAPYIFFRDHII